MRRLLFLSIVGIITLSGCVNVVDKSSIGKFACTENPKKIAERKYSGNPCILSDEKIKNKKAVVETDQGTFEFELNTETAPYTVSNFVFLAEDKFYDGLKIHRREDNLKIIQGGDPNGDGTGGPGYSFGEEPPASNADYKKGIVAMAKASSPNSTGSQFFIMMDDFTGFEPVYSIFGKIIKGQDIVNILQPGDTIKSIKIVNK